MKFSDFTRYFRDEAEQERIVVIADARDILSWMSSPYYSKFLEWLDENGDAPVRIGAQHMELVKDVTRVNVFREIRQYLARLERDAKNALNTSEE